MEKTEKLVCYLCKKPIKELPCEHCKSTMAKKMETKSEAEPMKFADCDRCDNIYHKCVCGEALKGKRGIMKHFGDDIHYYLAEDVAEAVRKHSERIFIGAIHRVPICPNCKYRVWIYDNVTNQCRDCAIKEDFADVVDNG